MTILLPVIPFIPFIIFILLKSLNFLTLFKGNSEIISSDRFSKAINEVKNQIEEENSLIEDLKSFVRKNPKLSESQLFSELDVDADGSITIQDFKDFALQKLNLLNNEINEKKIEKALKCISLNKNTYLHYQDVKE